MASIFQPTPSCDAPPWNAHLIQLNQLLQAKGLRFQVDETDRRNENVSLSEKYGNGFLCIGLSSEIIDWRKLMNDILKYQLFILSMGSLDGLILVEDQLFAISARDFCFLIDLKTVKFAKRNRTPSEN